MVSRSNAPRGEGNLARWLQVASTTRLKAKMAFIIKKSKNTVRLVRRTWQRNGNNSYAVQEVGIGSLPLTATELPHGFPPGQDELSEKELSALEEKVFAPARALAERLSSEAGARASDPLWRVKSAVDLLTDAAALSQDRPVSGEVMNELAQVIAAFTHTDPPVSPISDPLKLALAAVETATAAVKTGFYGSRPEKTPLKGTPVGELWNQLRHAVLAPEEGSLMRELQKTDWVKGGST